MRLPAKRLGVKVPRANAADGFVTQIKQLGWREPVREHRFHHVRMWRFDLAWPDYHLAVEVDGGGFVGGRHGRGMGIEKDCEKLAHAVIDGWRVMRVTPMQIRKGLAIQWVGQMLVDWGVR